MPVVTMSSFGIIKICLYSYNAKMIWLGFGGGKDEIK